MHAVNLSYRCGIYLQLVSIDVTRVMTGEIEIDVLGKAYLCGKTGCGGNLKGENVFSGQPVYQFGDV
jgi:hypothetical protein